MSLAISRGARTCSTGVHVTEYKELSCKEPTTRAPVPPELIIPLHQHTGAPCEPVVHPGDRVVAGQKIGDSKAFVSAYIHASASGVVKAVEQRPYFTGALVQSVVIETDPVQCDVEAHEYRKISSLSVEEIRQAVRNAGIVGLGGAAFPTHVKLTPPKDRAIDSVIINGCECEPFITCDHRNMIEKADDLIKGIEVLLIAVGARRAYIAIEDNKSNAISLLTEKSAQAPYYLRIVPLATRYPQGAEKQVIWTVLGRKVPPGKLPLDVGALVHNVGTVLAILEAVTIGKPFIERGITITGPCVKKPSNLLVKIGTPISFLLEQCGGFTEPPAKVIVGGPMTGWAQSTLDTPVVKGTSAIVALSSRMVIAADSHDCVRCGKCVKRCPMNLMPYKIGTLVQSGFIGEAERWGVMDCYECGSCAYVCPAHRPLVRFVREAKTQIIARRRKS